MKKIFLTLIALMFMTGCSQYSAMLGPSYTLVDTGSVLQATTSYGSSYSLGVVKKSVSDDLTSERICQTHHSSDLSKIFFETQDQENCIFDPMSIYR